MTTPGSSTNGKDFLDNFASMLWMRAVNAVTRGANTTICSR